MKIALIVLYLVVTIAMIAFIMLQRGSGADAGSAFGSGASGTVFGARGSANFLSKATKWLAAAFFVLALGMGVYEARLGVTKEAAAELGVMGKLPEPAAAPAAASEVPAAGGAATAPPATGEVPGASANTAEQTTATAPADETATQTSDNAAENAGKEDEKPQ